MLAVAAALVALMAGDKQNASCASETGSDPSSFVRASYAFQSVRLSDGTKITAGVSKSPCLAHNAVVRVVAYAQQSNGYRQVLDDYSLPEQVDVSRDGTITLVSHETVSILDEAAYVWNGTRYEFSPYKSTRYDVELEQRRPWSIRVRFAPGTNSITLKGTATQTFGDTYDFEARAGQRVTVQFTANSKAMAMSLYRGDDAVASYVSTGRWSGVLAKTGTYRLDVFGAAGADKRAAPYAVVVTIR